MESAGRTGSAVGLLLLALIAMVLLAPVAAATTSVIGPTLTPTSTDPEPMALATTGLDITVPVIIGLSMLVLGIAVVSWAFLRTGSADPRH